MKEKNFWHWRKLKFYLNTIVTDFVIRTEENKKNETKTKLKSISLLFR